jgi:prepilin-type N-terminal cleavage/methylation domain-containing protein
MIRRLKANRPLRLDDRGISLIEVMIAMFIFSVVALAISSLNVKTWQVTDLAKSYTEASTEASQKIESMISEKYVSNQASGMSPALIAGTTYASESSDGRYKISYEIRDNDVLPNTKSVQMTVSFYRGGVMKNIRYNYLLPLRK